jgi:hypothetical protein
MFGLGSRPLDLYRIYNSARQALILAAGLSIFLLLALTVRDQGLQTTAAPPE